MFHLVSLSLQISLTDLPGPCLGLCVGVACFVVLGGFVVGFFPLGKFDLNHMLIPVVDRPCLALVRQCRRKKTPTYCIISSIAEVETEIRGCFVTWKLHSCCFLCGCVSMFFFCVVFFFRTEDVFKASLQC